MADDLNNKKRKKTQKAENSIKRPKTGSKKKPGFDKDIFKETEYYIKDGLRYVKPYSFTFTTFCKGRWLRRKLIDVLSQEFQSETADYYRKAINSGNITVNGTQTTEDLILKDNDIISHKVHRHEPPVTAETIEIISETDDMVVVNKPSSIPIHPCGRYRHNTLVFLLAKEFGLTNLHTIHRIDRLTSGIVMFAKSLQKAQELEKQLREHEFQKEYVCKVHGEFPSEAIECNEPIAVVSHKVGVCRVHKDGKSCRTVFIRDSFDGTNSIVKCLYIEISHRRHSPQIHSLPSIKSSRKVAHEILAKISLNKGQPSTGRMHQIRVHLQWLGYPIIDDPIYNHEAWGRDKGRGGVEEDKAWKVIESIATSLRNNDAGLDSQLKSQTDSTTGQEETRLVQECDRKSESLRNEASTCDELNSMSETSESTTEMKEKKAVVLPDDVEDKELKGITTFVDECDKVKSTMVSGLEEHSVLTENEIKNNSNTVETCGEFSNSGVTVVRNETAKRNELYSSGDHKDPGCTECQINRRDPTPAELTMCLHAAVYKGPNWEFRCPWPSWALPNND